MAISNIEYKDGVVDQSYITFFGTKRTAAVVLEIRFNDNTKMNAKLFVTEGAARRTVDTLREIGWKGASFVDFDNNPLKGSIVNCTIGDQVDRDGNVILNNSGVPFREIKYVNKPKTKPIEKGSKEEIENLANHFDYLIGSPCESYFSEDSKKASKPQNATYDDDDCPF